MAEYKLFKKGEFLKEVEVDGIVYRLIAKTEDFAVELSTIEPGSEIKKPYTHGGSEFHYVLEGKFLIILGDEKVELGEGESIIHSSEIPHAWKGGDVKATVLSVNCPPTFM